MAPIPLRMREVEGYLIGKAVCEETAQAAAELAVENATALANNAYKFIEMKTMLKDAILRMQ